MRYAFIVNPASGQGRQHQNLETKIQNFIKNNPDRDINVYHTTGEKDATVIADCIAREAKDDVLVFACGGDGTLQEITNGLVGHDNAIMAIVPTGSGNDFVRTLGGSEKAAAKYMNLQVQLDAPIKKIDLIRLSWVEGTSEKSVYINNSINIGFDGYTAITAHEYKKIPGVAGTGSYILAVAKNLIKKKGEKLKIIADGEEIFEGALLLATVGNGAYCGGGFKSCPNANLNDGLLELLIAKEMSRIDFLKIIPKYKSGNIFDVPNDNEIFYKYTQAEKIRITPIDSETMQFVGDGEIFETGELTVEVVRDALNVVYI